MNEALEDLDKRIQDVIGMTINTNWFETYETLLLLLKVRKALLEYKKEKECPPQIYDSVHRRRLQ